MDPSVLQGDRTISFVSHHTRATSMNIMRARHACDAAKQNFATLCSGEGSTGHSRALVIPSCKDAPSL